MCLIVSSDDCLEAFGGCPGVVSRERAYSGQAEHVVAKAMSVPSSSVVSSLSALGGHARAACQRAAARHRDHEGVCRPAALPRALRPETARRGIAQSSSLFFSISKADAP